MVVGCGSLSLHRQVCPSQVVVVWWRSVGVPQMLLVLRRVVRVVRVVVNQVGGGVRLKVARKPPPTAVVGRRGSAHSAYASGVVMISRDV